jgi:hypothetical protein
LCLETGNIEVVSTGKRTAPTSHLTQEVPTSPSLNELRLPCPEARNTSPPINLVVLEKGLKAWSKIDFPEPKGVGDQFHGPSLLLELSHRPWKLISSLGGLTDMIQSLQPPIAEGWTVCENDRRSPLGIPWNECPLWRKKVGTYASETCRILVVADPDLSNSPIALWEAYKGLDPTEPRMLDSFCWYPNKDQKLLVANIEAIVFDLLGGKTVRPLSSLSSPGVGKSEVGFSAPPRDLVDFTFAGKLKSSIGQYARDAKALLKIIDETKSNHSPILDSLDFMKYSPRPLKETKRQVMLTASTFLILLDRE